LAYLEQLIGGSGYKKQRTWQAISVFLLHFKQMLCALCFLFMVCEPRCYKLRLSSNGNATLGSCWNVWGLSDDL